MKMIDQPAQEQQGAGGIIQQNSAVKTAVNNPSIYGVLPPANQAGVTTINGKALGDWTEGDYAYMVSMLTVARHC